MNKRELVDAVGERVGSKKAAGEAVEAVIAAITEKVASGEKVVLAGFGSFERVQRPARDARNPQTGATVHVPATNVPKFKAFDGFKGAVAGPGKAA